MKVKSEVFILFCVILINNEDTKIHFSKKLKGALMILLYHTSLFKNMIFTAIYNVCKNNLYRFNDISIRKYSLHFNQIFL